MNKPERVAFDATVHGHVQGVGFRYSAQKKALGLGLTGWVRNRADRTVETRFEGSSGACADFLKWLHHGPPGARVLRVDQRKVEAQDVYRSFDITY